MDSNSKCDSEAIIDFKKPRNRTLEHAKDYEKFYKDLAYFMGINNMRGFEKQMVLHLLNSFYFTGYDIESGFS